MDYKCPHCGRPLAPDPARDTQKDGRLRCPYCMDWYRPGRGGRLRKAQSIPTLGEMLRQKPD